jgi:hypothetical protein
LDGTGQIYKATEESKDQIAFTRQDSTYFIGYNGENFNFSYRDTLYSFGGTGFWKVNGQLRSFSEEIAEWNITKINKEYPLTDFLTNYLPEKSRLYYITQPINDAATFDKTTDYSVIELNLLNKFNSKLGILNKKFVDLFSSRESVSNDINLASLNGTLLYFSTEDQYLLNFEKNKAYKLINPRIKDLFYRKSAGNIPTNCFEFNKNIYFQFPSDSSNQLRSIPISMNDFEYDGIELYEAEGKGYRYLLYSFLAILLITGLGLIAKWYYKKVSSATKNVVAPSLNIDFNEQEKHLINYLIEKSNIGSLVSVEELNFSLGISKKTLEIQKRTRTETIHKINHKFRLLFELETDFIERVRSEDDKRYYNYSINSENAALYKTKYKK